MRLALINTNGQLSFHDEDEDLRPLIGPEGPARVRLDPRTRAAGFVNDCGHLRPEDYPRTPTGSCVLTALGATPQPYAGPVVITGWDPHREPIEMCGLADDGLVVAAWRDVITALHTQPRPEEADLPEAELVGGAAGWDAAVRAFAEHVRTAPHADHHDPLRRYDHGPPRVKVARRRP